MLLTKLSFSLAESFGLGFGNAISVLLIMTRDVTLVGGIIVKLTLKANKKYR